MPWGQPIDLVSKDYQSRRTITNAAAALQWLRETPSLQAGHSLHRAAIDACLADKEGKAERARALFIRAARASGFLVETAHWYGCNTPLPSATEIAHEALQPIMTPCKKSLLIQKR